MTARPEPLGERCEQSDLPKIACAHCGARPGDNLPPERPWTFDGQKMTRRTGRDVFPTAPTPTAEPRPLKFSDHTAGTCACGRPTRDNAYGCDDCADELSRFLGDATWLAEQLDTTITRQKGKHPTAGGRSADAIVWHDKASKIQKGFRRYLRVVVRYCVATHVTHSSPYLGHPDTREAMPAEMAGWLLWRVDGLTHKADFDALLRAALKLEEQTLRVIDAAPDLLYLGICGAQHELEEPCDGAVYAIAGEDVGKCRVCRARYDTEARRTGLQQKLDDRLCTAAEIAHLATYLGIDAKRSTVRNLVNQWHKRKRITAAPGVGDPRFRYGDIAPLLAATYDSKGA